MTFGASEGHAQKDRPGGVRYVVENFLAASAQILRVVLFRIMPVESRGDASFEAAGPDFVTGDLFADESIIGLVAVEGVNDVIAIRPGPVAKVDLLVSIGFAIAHHIEPMPRPMFAIGRRG